DPQSGQQQPQVRRPDTFKDQLARRLGTVPDELPTLQVRGRLGGSPVIVNLSAGRASAGDVAPLEPIPTPRLPEMGRVVQHELFRLEEEIAKEHMAGVAGVSEESTRRAKLVWVAAPARVLGNCLLHLDLHDRQARWRD